MQDPENKKMTFSDYLDFLKDKGIPLSGINPGSDEFALETNDALKAIELLRNVGKPILGGDILSLEKGDLIYVYQKWGEEYHTLNWFCDQEENESESNFIVRSFNVAEESIFKAEREAKKRGDKCLIVLVA